MSYATYEYLEPLLKDLLPGESPTYKEFLRTVKTPLKDSIAPIKERIHVSEYKMMLYIAALLLYEEGVRQFHYKNLLDKIDKTRLTEKSRFDTFSIFGTNFDNMLRSGVFVKIPSSLPQNDVEKKYALNEDTQKQLDELAKQKGN